MIVVFPSKIIPTDKEHRSLDDLPAYIQLLSRGLEYLYIYLINLGLL